MKLRILFYSVFIIQLSLLFYFKSLSYGNDFCAQFFENKVPRHLVSLNPTVEIQGRIYKNGNPVFFVLNRVGSTWSSGAATGGFLNAPYGNPMWFQFIVGQKIARFFGFNVFDSFGLAPTSHQVNLKIKQMNEYLPDRYKLIVSTYEPLIQQEIKSDFVFSFARNLSIPLGGLGDLITLHDLSYHLMTIMLPNDIVLLLQQQLLVVFEFLDYLNTSANEYVRSDVTKKVILEIASSLIDYGTGNTTAFLADYNDSISLNDPNQKNLPRIDKKYLWIITMPYLVGMKFYYLKNIFHPMGFKKKEYIDYYNWKGKDLNDVLKKETIFIEVDSFSFLNQIISESFIKFKANSDKIEKHFRDDLNKMFKMFVYEKQIKLNEKSNSSMSKYHSQNIELICVDLIEKINAVEKAVGQINKTYDY